MQQSKIIAVSIALTFSVIGLFGQERGSAGYYADEFHGRKTASGELYDKDALTGAHRTYEFGSYVKVTRLDNNKSVVIKINDRGPYIKGRIIDLSRKAAEILDLVRAGHAEVTVEPVKGPEEISATEPVEKPRLKEPEKEEIAAKTGEPQPALVSVKPEKQAVAAKEKKDDKPAQPAKQTEPTPSTEDDLPKVTSQDYKTFGLYKIQVMRPKKEGYGIQVASYTNYDNVMKMVADLQENHFKNILVSVEKGQDNQPVYKILLGPFPDIEKSNSYKSSLKKKYNMDGFTVNLSDIKDH